MKINNSLLIFLFLTLASCSFSVNDTPISTPTTSRLAEMTDFVSTTPNESTSTPVLTETPIPTLTTLPSPTPTLPIDDIVERPYNPGEWSVLYDKNSIWGVQLDPAGRMWISPGGESAYFDGDKWVFLAEDDYPAPYMGGVLVAPDGSLWTTAYQTLSRYKDGTWEIFPIPDADATTRTGIAFDASGSVWIMMSTCPDYCFVLKKCDGNNWIDVPLWTTEMRGQNPPQMLFTPDGALWVVGNKDDIGRYDGKNWKIYSEADLWLPEEWVRTVRITSDPDGNIYGISTEQSGHVSWVTKIDISGQITKYPVPTKLEFWQNVLRLFVDSQGTIWVNACLDDRSDTCLAYYKDEQWVSFTDLPTGRMLDMKELSDGTFLVASIFGLYQFEPEE
jgi:streptogramin lyase